MMNNFIVITIRKYNGYELEVFEVFNEYMLLPTKNHYINFSI